MSEMKGPGTCPVIGGSRMLGFEIVGQPRAAGNRVRLLDFRPLPDAAPGVEARIGDLRLAEDVDAACEGMDTVFLMAAAVWDVHTPRKVYEEVNVQGTANVIEACRRHRIRRLVYASSMDVVVDGRKLIVSREPASERSLAWLRNGA